MEIMIVIILIGIIASFAVPNYQKAIQKAQERDGVIQLATIHAACQIYRAQYGIYFDGTLSDLAAINSTFKLGIIANEKNYSYTGNSAADTFQVTATWQRATAPFSIMITESPIDETSNPCCVSGCYYVANGCPTTP